MKKLLIIIAMVVTGSTLALGQVAQDTASANNTAAQEKRQKIRIEELPEGVKQALEDEAFKGWMINSAFRDARKDEFEVELKNGVERQIVRFSADGKRLKSKR